MEIRYDVTDWANDYKSSTTKPTSLDEAIELMRESNIKPGELAKLLIIGRELGIVKDSRLPTNKISNLTGMALHVSRHRSRQVAQTRIAGKDVEVPRFIANATVEEDVEAGFEFTVPNGNPDVTVVDYNDPVAADRAIAYLMTNVLGRIQERLRLIALNKPQELGRVVKELKKAIDDMAKELK